VSGLDRRALGVLGLGHLSADFCQGALPALLPFLIAERGLSLASAGTMMLAATVSSSATQVAFGFLSDRRPMPGLMPLGVLLAGAGLAFVGVVAGFAQTLLCVVLSGVGIAAFHPESARFVNHVSGSAKAQGMSFFSVGGNAGFAFGPVVATPPVLLFGLPGTLLLVAPAAIAAVVLFRETPRMLGFAPGPAEPATAGTGETSDRWWPFAGLLGVVAFRSFVFLGLVAFVAAYYGRVLGSSPALGNAALAAMLFGGAAGTLLAGSLADRFGHRAVVVATMAALPPLILGFMFSGVYPGMVLLALVGAAAMGTTGVAVVMGQEYLPHRMGLAAGVTMGLSLGLGGLGPPLLGLLADANGLEAAMLATAALPVAGLLLALALPRE
jgi:FSR family fosmidomycin resistance protein-like MFS transporter